eukprot:g13237.t1
MIAPLTQHKPPRKKQKYGKRNSTFTPTELRSKLFDLLRMLENTKDISVIEIMKNRLEQLLANNDCREAILLPQKKGSKTKKTTLLHLLGQYCGPDIAPSILKLFLDHIGRTNATTFMEPKLFTDEIGQTPLHDYAINGHVQCIRIFIEFLKGKRLLIQMKKVREWVNYRDGEKPANLLGEPNMTALHHCCIRIAEEVKKNKDFNNYVEVAKVLLENGADITAVDEANYDVMHLIIPQTQEKEFTITLERGKELADFAQYLIDQGASVKTLSRHEDLPPLCWVVLLQQDNLAPLVEVLVNNGADPNFSIDKKEAYDNNIDNIIPGLKDTVNLTPKKISILRDLKKIYNIFDGQRSSLQSHETTMSSNETVNLNDETVEVSKSDLRKLIQYLDVAVVDFSDPGYKWGNQICIQKHDPQLLHEKMQEEKEKIETEWKKLHDAGKENHLKLKLINYDGNKPKYSDCGPPESTLLEAEKKIIEELWKYFSQDRPLVRVNDCRVEKVKENYSNENLIGQATLVATKVFDRYTLVGPYAGQLMLQEDYRVVTKSVRQKMKNDDYGFDLNMGIKYDRDGGESDSSSSSNEEILKYLTIHAYPRFGNKTMCINDPYETKKKANAMFVECVYMDWPYVFVFTKGNRVKKDEEFLINYSVNKSFFKGRKRGKMKLQIL